MPPTWTERCIHCTRVLHRLAILNSTIETAVVVNGASAACPLAGTRLSTQTSQSFAEVCASQMRPAPENGLASSTPPSSRTPSQSADLQSQPLIAANVKPSANRKSVSPNCPDSPPVAAASVPANQVFNFPPGLETSLVGMNLGSYENGNDQGDFGIRTELVSKSGVAATSIPPEPNSCDATAVSVPQFSDSISSSAAASGWRRKFYRRPCCARTIILQFLPRTALLMNLKS